MKQVDKEWNKDIGSGRMKVQRLVIFCFCLIFTGCGSPEAVQTESEDAWEAVLSTEAGNREGVENPQKVEAVVTEPTTIRVYSQLSGWSGEQQGWFAEVMLDEFNVKLEYIWDYEEDTQLSTVADMIVFGSRQQYMDAVEAGHLLDWEANDLLAEYGGYILEHLPKALEYNRALTPQEGKIFGLGNNMVPNTEVCEDFFLTWDVRWDLYKALGYCQVQDLEDMVGLLEEMKHLCPTDEKGEDTYAMSLWSDWDQNMMMYAKSMVTAYYGYDELGMGLYDSQTGDFHGALEENGPYLEMLRFLNTLYRKGLLDPSSRTQTYENMLDKLQSGGVLFSVFQYAGAQAYNTEVHLSENKYMASLVPEEATPAAYGLSVYGGHRNWAISADTQYPELCMSVINWFATPEGRMTQEYGPRGMFWEYDEEGNTYFTELGKRWWEERVIQIPLEYGGGYFYDGCPQINHVIWNYRSPNPDSNGETYDCESWKSNLKEPSCDMELDWRLHTRATSINEYIKSGKHVVIPDAHYEQGKISGELGAVWAQVAECIVNGSWDAVYAESEAEFAQIVLDMQAEAERCGYALCMRWCMEEAKKRHGLELNLENSGF